MVTMPKPKPAAHDYKGGHYRPENSRLKGDNGQVIEWRGVRGRCIDCGGPKSAHFMEE